MQNMLDPRELAARFASYSPQQLSQMDHASLYQAREYMQDRAQQNQISPYEHRAFAREATRDNPWLGLPIAAGTMLYQPVKAALGQSRSDPSINQVGQGLMGVGEGLWGAFQDGMRSIASRTEGTGTQTSSIAPLESLRSYLHGSSKERSSRR